jgi:hypothetical protein
MEKLWLSPAYGLELLGPHGHGQLLLLLPGCSPYLHHTHIHSVLTISFCYSSPSQYLLLRAL